jgi:hypothetical protein
LQGVVRTLRDGQNLADVIRAILATEEFRSRERGGLHTRILSAFNRHAALSPAADRVNRLIGDIANFCSHRAAANPIDIVSLLGSRDFHDPVVYRWWLDDYERPRAEGTLAALRPVEARFSLFVSATEPVSALAATVTSVSRQGYNALDLVILTDGRSGPEIVAAADSFATDNARVNHLAALPGETPAQQLLRAWRRCGGDFVGCVQCGDQLAATTAAELTLAHGTPSTWDIIFTDSDTIDADGLRRDPCFRTAWDPDRIVAGDTPAFAVYSRLLIERLGGWRDVGEGMEWVDLSLRAAAATTRHRAQHVPLALYHQRARTEGTPKADRHWHDIVRQFARSGCRVSPGFAPGTVRVIHPLPQPTPLVSILIPTTGRSDLLGPCLEGIRDRTNYRNVEVLIIVNRATELNGDWSAAAGAGLLLRVIVYDCPFDWGRVNNIGAMAARGDVLVFLNDDTVVLHDDWLDELVSQTLRPDVGAVGARLVYRDGRIQHAGIALSSEGGAYHVMRHAEADSHGYLKQVHLVREVSAVTGACIAVKAEIFHLVGGLEESMLPITYSDIDFCLRVSERGYRILWTPYACLMHPELSTRGYDETPEKVQRATEERLYFKWRWSKRLGSDPFWSPNLAFSEAPELAVPPRWFKRAVG